MPRVTYLPNPVAIEIETTTPKMFTKALRELFFVQTDEQGQEYIILHQDSKTLDILYGAVAVWKILNPSFDYNYPLVKLMNAVKLNKEIKVIIED